MRLIFLLVLCLLSACVIDTHPEEFITVDIVQINDRTLTSSEINFITDSVITYCGVNYANKRVSFVRERLPDLLVPADLLELKLKYSKVSPRTLTILVAPGNFYFDYVYGLQFYENSYVIFKDGMPDDYVKGVLLHELGHCLGLVNVENEKAKYEDKYHRFHCTNPKCVMYYASPPGDPYFDEKCLETLKRLSKKCLK